MSSLSPKAWRTGRAAVRRHPGHRRDRPHGDQHPLRRDVARRRNRACAHAAGDRGSGRAAGEIHSAADAGRDLDGRRLSHGRVARDPVHPAALGRRPAGVGRDVRAHGVCRSDGGGRSRHGAGRAAYIHRVSATTTVASVTDDDLQDGGGAYVLTDKYIPAYVSVVRIRGPFLFGATEKLEHATADLTKFAEIVVLKMTYMTAIDGTGIHAFESLATRLKESRPAADRLRRPTAAGRDDRPLEAGQAHRPAKHAAAPRRGTGTGGDHPRRFRQSPRPRNCLITQHFRLPPVGIRVVVAGSADCD